MQSHIPQRRRLLQFLASQTAAQATLGVGGLALAGQATAQIASDSKFMVCLHLRGGNDHANTVAPTSGTDYNAYKAARPAICLAAGQFRPISPINSPGPSLGLHPNLGFVAQAFNAGEAALVANVGTLVQPMTTADWNKGAPRVPVPAQLFSHNDQESQWQTASPRVALASGWAGRMADRLTEVHNGSGAVPLCMNAGRANVLLTGQETLSYRITSGGSAILYPVANGIAGSGVAGSALRTLVTQPRPHAMEAHLADMVRRSIELESKVRTAVSGVRYSTVFPDTLLGRQLKAVADMIVASSALGQKRQMFFADLDNCDFHDNLVVRHAERLQVLDDALRAFVAFLKETQTWQKTVVFTTSDFGRALQSNGKGADHGWGSHHVVLGGPVVGRKIHGQWPVAGLGTAEDLGQGRLLPTTANDQYVATLARWFGVTSDSDMRYVLPNIGNFSNTNLGFLG